MNVTPIESDNDAERESRIAEILKKIRKTQERVEALAAEGRRRAEEVEKDRATKSRPGESG